MITSPQQTAGGKKPPTRSPSTSAATTSSNKISSDFASSPPAGMVKAIEQQHSVERKRTTTTTATTSVAAAAKSSSVVPPASASSIKASPESAHKSISNNSRTTTATAKTATTATTRPPSSSNVAVSVTPSMELAARAVDCVATALQHRTATLLIPASISVEKLAHNHPQLHSLCSAAKDALEAFAQLELSSASATTTPSPNATPGALSTATFDILASLGDAAAVVSDRTATLLQLLAQVREKLAADRAVPPSHRKSVVGALDEAKAAAADIRSSAEALHGVRTAILSRDLNAAQSILTSHAAAETAVAGKLVAPGAPPSQAQQQQQQPCSPLPSVIVRWLRRAWVPAMKAWHDLVRRFNEDKARIMAASSASAIAELININNNSNNFDSPPRSPPKHTQQQQDKVVAARIAETLNRYMDEVRKSSLLLAAIAVPGSSVESLVAETIEAPLNGLLEHMRRKEKLRASLRRAVDSMDITALSQGVRDLQKETPASEEERQLIHEAKSVLAKLQNLGRITAGLTMVQQQQQQQQQCQDQSRDNDIDGGEQSKGKKSRSSSSTSQLRETVSALHQCAVVVLNEKWFISETQCAMAVAFGEKLMRCSTDKEIDEALFAVLDLNSFSSSSSSSAANNVVTVSPSTFKHQQPQQQQQQVPKTSTTTAISVVDDAAERRLDQLLVARVTPNKFWPAELSQLYGDVARRFVVQPTVRRAIFAAAVSLAKRLTRSSSLSSSSAVVEEQDIARCRALLAKVEAASAPATTSIALALTPDVTESVAVLRKIVADNAARTLKIHYDSNLRLVHVADVFHFSSTIAAVMGSLDIGAATLQTKGPLRVRVADGDGDFITVVSQSEWELVLKECSCGASHNSASSGVDGSSVSSSSSKKMELFLDHLAPPAGSTPGGNGTPARPASSGAVLMQQQHLQHVMQTPPPAPASAASAARVTYANRSAQRQLHFQPAPLSSPAPALQLQIRGSGAGTPAAVDSTPPPPHPQPPPPGLPQTPIRSSPHLAARRASAVHSSAVEPPSNSKRPTTPRSAAAASAAVAINSNNKDAVSPPVHIAVPSVFQRQVPQPQQQQKLTLGKLEELRQQQQLMQQLHNFSPDPIPRDAVPPAPAGWRRPVENLELMTVASQSTMAPSDMMVTSVPRGNLPINAAAVPIGVWGTKPPATAAAANNNNHNTNNQQHGGGNWNFDGASQLELMTVASEATASVAPEHNNHPNYVPLVAVQRPASNAVGSVRKATPRTVATTHNRIFGASPHVVVAASAAAVGSGVENRPSFRIDGTPVRSKK